MQTRPWIPALAAFVLSACVHHVPRAPIPLINSNSGPSPTGSATTTASAAAQPAAIRAADAGASLRSDSGAQAPALAREDSNAQVRQALGNLNEILDAFFDYNEFRLRPDAVSAVAQAARLLAGHLEADAKLRLVVEGHCDERGSAEFNLALGDRRAEAVRELLAQFGLPPQRITTISYGETRPACGEATENCWQRNRRAHIRHERE